MNGSGVPASQADPVFPPDTPPVRSPLEAQLAFTGLGSEYFRIWVVNTVLTVLTLGIYSAWAKVRKASYFARNTVLLGDSFEFIANPVAILRGRIVALVLFGFYTFAFDFSLALGLVATVTLLALAPLLLASASRFRLQNTRWRAVRFEFTATRGASYRAALIVVALWISGTVVGSVLGLVSAAFCGVLAIVMLPWMHHRLKAFQHRHVRFAGHASSFRSAVGAFYGTYVLAFLLGIVGVVVAGLLAFIPVSLMHRSANPKTLAFIIGALVSLFGYVVSWPYFAARIQRTVWARTALGPFTFRTTIAYGALFLIVLRNAALLVVTAGLGWPFASVAWARYRIGCMTLSSDLPPDGAFAAIDPGMSRSTVGEGAADFFGMDVGW